MTTDPTIRQRAYQYFLQEAPELLQALEQGLRHFKTDRSINQVHQLLRATHTLKGAANSVGLETIATVAHSLEDIFKALCNPEVLIDREVEALLFEGFECLRLSLTAELTNGTIDQAEILDRTATVFAQLQEKLGDCFDENTPFPSSAELGFDITQSIFEVGVSQRLEQLSQALEQSNLDELETLLRTQAEVFLGIGESLNLPGFGAIAQATIAALNHHPNQVIEIAQQAVMNFQQGQAAVLAGDRTQGGQPSEALQQWANLAETESSLTLHLAIDSEFKTESENSVDVGFHDSLAESIWGTVTTDDITLKDTALDDAILDEITSDEITSDTLISDHLALNPHDARDSETNNAGMIPPSSISVDELSFVLSPSVQPSRNTPTPVTAKASDPRASQVRVDVKHLDHLNDSIGELLTQQNSQSLQAEHLRASVRTLLSRLKQHQHQLNQLQILAERQSRISNQLSSESDRKKRKSRSNQGSKEARRNNHLNLNPPLQKYLDALQLEQTNQSVRSLMGDLVQITEAAEAIDLFVRRSDQTLETQRQLLTNTRNALIEARMLPSGEILHRFPHVLQQLEVLYSKPVELQLQGTEVLVDKTIAERLYDPLLHLVRNAFDHGLEPSSLRTQQGKPVAGKIEISAYNQGRYLVIEVRDDGKGLDYEEIRQRAVEKRLISWEQAQAMTSAELVELLFEPGFSTARQVNDLSGRGIGLDVVRNQIQALQGAVTVTSNPHQGTTFTLQIPLNLTIAPLLVCEADSKIYAFLDDAIEQVLLPQSEQIQERNQGKALQWRKGDRTELVPLHSLTQVLNYRSALTSLTTPPATVTNPQGTVKPVLLLRHHDTVLGLEVDRLRPAVGNRLIGEQELVIRPLGSLLESPNYVHGATILADGSIALVLDGTLLLQSALAQSSQFTTVKDSTFASQALPARGKSDLRPAVGDQFPLESSSLPPASPQILIAEDSITARQTLALTLEKFGYQVFQAQDGQEAIDQLQQQPQIQLVICDIEMPGMNGFEFLRRAQQIPEVPHIPILMLSSRSDEKHRSLAAQLGATAYMTKPYIEYKLLSLVVELLERAGVNRKSEQ
jgi:chemotaxis family two-component system sensor histidine kinase/response regulator PixL